MLILNVVNRGTLTKGEGAFTNPFKSIYSDTAPSINGTQVAVASIERGDQGFGRWGGAFDFPDLSEGQEIWFRVFIYYPIGFDFTISRGVGLKTLRIHTASSTGSNEGYFDMLSNGIKGITVGSEITSDFFENNARWKAIGSPIITGRYHAYEQYVKFSSEPGKGIYRVWQDGKLVFEDTQTKTMRSTTSVSDFIYIWSYWNGNAPKSQEAYLDYVVITNETPVTKDKNGNPYIGLGGVELFTTPNPPKIKQLK